MCYAFNINLYHCHVTLIRIFDVYYVILFISFSLLGMLNSYGIKNYSVEIEDK